MKTLLMALAAALLSTPALAGDVTVTLTGVEARGGEILLTLNGRDTFLRGAGEHTETREGSTSGDLTLTFEDVAPGEYALMVMHDANGNNRFDMSPMGMPDEGYAFSNGSEMMGMPTFDAHKFTVTEAGATITAAMAYPAAR